MASTKEAEKVEEDRQHQEADRLDRERKRIRNMKMLFALFSALLLIVLLLSFFLNR